MINLDGAKLDGSTRVEKSKPIGRYDIFEPGRLNHSVATHSTSKKPPVPACFFCCRECHLAWLGFTAFHNSEESKPQSKQIQSHVNQVFIFQWSISNFCTRLSITESCLLSVLSVIMFYVVLYFDHLITISAKSMLDFCFCWLLSIMPNQERSSPHSVFDCFRADPKIWFLSTWKRSTKKIQIDACWGRGIRMAKDHVESKPLNT